MHPVATRTIVAETTRGVGSGLLERVRVRVGERAGGAWGLRFVVLTLAMLTANAGDSSPPALVPLPRSVEWRSGHFSLDRETRVVREGVEAGVAGRWSERMRMATGLPLRTRRGEGREGADNSIRLRWETGAGGGLGEEGYRLEVTPGGIRVSASAERGLYYAGTTLLQLLPVRGAGGEGVEWVMGSGRVPAVRIEDAPRFRWRGLLLDPARHFLPPADVERMMDLMAMHKLNRLQLHLTDDQGWRLEIRGHARLTSVGSVRRESPRPGQRELGDGTPYGPYYYTRADIRRLVRSAAARQIELVPEIEMPGHFLAALAVYPELSCRGGPFEVRTRWGVEPDILCAGNDRAVAFAKEVLGEVVDLFPGEFVHIGGDEAPRDRWRECAKCQARMRAEGLKNEAELQTWFNRQMETFLVGRGRRLIGWDEILEGGLTPGAAVMSWRGVEGGKAAARAGHDVVMAPTTHCYLDYAQARGPGEPESIGGFIPLSAVYAFEPIPEGLPGGAAAHILGVQGNLWSEYLRSRADVEYFAFPRAIALAEVGWGSSVRTGYPEFLARLRPHLERLRAAGVNYRRLDAE